MRNLTNFTKQLTTSVIWLRFVRPVKCLNNFVDFLLYILMDISQLGSFSMRLTVTCEMHERRPHGTLTLRRTHQATYDRTAERYELHHLPQHLIPTWPLHSIDFFSSYRQLSLSHNLPTRFDVLKPEAEKIGGRRPALPYSLSSRAY